MAATNPLHLTADLIQRLASPGVYRRGQSYVKAGHVQNLVRRGQTVEALVQGSQPTHYWVVLRSEVHSVVGTCTCDYSASWDGWCKHMVAVGLAVLQAGDTLPQRPKLEEMLAAADPDSLRHLLLVLAGPDPRLTLWLEQLLEQVQLQDQAVALAMARAAEDPTGQVGHYVQQMHRLLQSLDAAPLPGGLMAALSPDAEGSWYALDSEEWEEELDVDWQEDVQSNLYDLVDAIAQLNRQGQAGQTLAILAAIVPLVLADPGVAGGLAQAQPYGSSVEFWHDWWYAVDRTLAQALLLAAPEPAAAGEWYKLTQTWTAPLAELGLQDVLSGAQFVAHMLAQPGPALVERLLAAKLPDAIHEDALQVLDLLGEETAYLALARRSVPQAYIEKLIALGRAEELLGDAILKGQNGAMLFDLAQKVHAAGQTQAALQLARRAIRQPGAHLYATAVWVRTVATKVGDRGLAVDAALLALLARPNLADYGRLHTLAGDAWPELKPDVLAALREQGDGPHLAGLREIWLAEGMIVEALALLGPSPTLYDVQALAEAGLKHQPETLMRIAIERAQSLAAQGQSTLYAQVVEWLTLARSAAKRIKREDEWRAALDRLRREQGRKRKLVELLRTLG